MALYLPQRWRQAPDGPVELDYGHPLTRGLMQAVVGSIGAFDLVSGRADAAPLGKAVHGSGIGLYQEGPHADYTTRAARLPWRRAVCEGRTQFVAGYWTTTTASAGLIVASAGGITTTSERIRLGSDNSLRMQIHGNAYGATTAVYNGTSSSGELLNRDMTLAQRWHKDKNSGYGEAWVNGKTVARTSGTPQTVVSDCASFSDLDDYWYLSGGTAYGTTGILHAFYQWSRDLADGELAALQENKWQMLRPRRPVIISLPTAGGITYNDTLSEGVTLSASTADAATFASALNEAVTLAESVASAHVMPATIAESLALGDLVSGGLLLNDGLTEGITLGSDYAAAAVRNVVLSEGLTLGADFATTQTFVDAFAEGVTLGEGLAAGLLLEAALAETATLGDDFVSTVTKDETLTESVTLGDSFAATLVTAGAISEGVTLADSVTATAVYPAVLSEDVVLGVPLVDEHIQGGVYNDTLVEALTLGDSYSTSLVAAAALTENLTLDASFYTPPLGQSVRSGGGGGGGRAWGWELDREVEEEMGTLLEGPPLTPATIEAVARRLDAPAESRIIGLKQPPVPAVSFEAAMVRRRRIRRRLLLLL